jgi:rhodanese-related sulfurtransferase
MISSFMNQEIDVMASTATPSSVIPFTTTNYERLILNIKSREELLSLLDSIAQVEVPFAGVVTPHLAWAITQTGLASLVDIRTNEERVFVGRVPNTAHIPWVTGTAFNRNPRFLKELESKIGKDSIILLICRSGRRSAEAAEAATKIGFKHVYNVLQGFEGDKDSNQQRGHLGGWRLANLPWEQD